MNQTDYILTIQSIELTDERIADPILTSQVCIPCQTDYNMALWRRAG